MYFVYLELILNGKFVDKIRATRLTHAWLYVFVVHTNKPMGRHYFKVINVSISVAYSLTYEYN